MRDRAGLVIGAVLGLVMGLGERLGGQLAAGLLCALILGPVGAVVGGLVAKMVGKITRQLMLRGLLIHEDADPWHYADFLLFASDLLLLRQENDIIRFRHLLLRNHFAALMPER